MKYLLILVILSSCTILHSTDSTIEETIINSTCYVRIEKKIEDPINREYQYYLKVTRYNKNYVYLYNTRNTQFILVDQKTFNMIEEDTTYKLSNFSVFESKFI